MVRPKLCVITPIDYDHEAWLGSSIEAIAGEKAGILKAGVPAVIARQRPEALAVIQAVASQTVRHSSSLDDFEQIFGQRLQGIASSTDLLVSRNWGGAPLGQLVRRSPRIQQRTHHHVAANARKRIEISNPHTSIIGATCFLSRFL